MSDMYNIINESWQDISYDPNLTEKTVPPPPHFRPVHYEDFMPYLNRIKSVSLRELIRGGNSPEQGMGMYQRNHSGSIANKSLKKQIELQAREDFYSKIPNEYFNQNFRLDSKFFNIKDNNAARNKQEEVSLDPFIVKYSTQLEIVESHLVDQIQKNFQYFSTAFSNFNDMASEMQSINETVSHLHQLNDTNK